jgi:hypothetical protein
MRKGPAPLPSAFRRLHLSLRRVAPFPLGVAEAKASPAWDAERPAGSEVYVPAVRLPRRAARVDVGGLGAPVHGTFRYEERPAAGGRAAPAWPDVCDGPQRAHIRARSGRRQGGRWSPKPSSIRPPIWRRHHPKRADRGGRRDRQRRHLASRGPTAPTGADSADGGTGSGGSHRRPNTVRTPPARRYRTGGPCPGAGDRARWDRLGTHRGRRCKSR